MPGRYMGDQNKCGIYFESGTYASISGALYSFGGGTAWEIQNNINLQRLKHASTGTRDTDEFIIPAKDHAANATYHPKDWRMLFFALGSVVDASGSTSTHTISAINNDAGNPFVASPESTLPTFSFYDSSSIAKAGSNVNQTLYGCMVNTFNIDWDAGGILTCDFSAPGQYVAFDSGAQPGISGVQTNRSYLASDVQLHIPSGTVVAELKGGHVGIDNDLQLRHYSNGSIVTYMPRPNMRRYQLDLTLDDNSTWGKAMLDQYHLGGSSFNALLSIRQSASNNIIITMSGCRANANPRPKGPEGMNETTFSFQPQTMIAVASDTIVKYGAW